MPPRKTAASSSSKSTTPAGAVNKRTRSNSSSDNEGPSLPAGKKARKGKGKAPEDENDDDAAAVIPKGTTKMVTVIKRGLAPVDPRSGFVDSHLVYSNKAEVWDAILNQTDLSGHENKNKFYVLQILHPANDKSKCVLFTRWGRVGANGQSSFGGPYSPTVAVKEFKTLFMAKTGVTWARRFGMVPKKGKYAWIERTYGDEDVPQDVEGSQNTEPVPESKLEPEIKDLCNLMFSTSLLDAHLTALNYDAKKLPLGQLGKTTVIDAYAVLQLLDEVIKEPKGERARSYKGFRTACENLSSAYYTLIPHDFGRRRPTIINNATLLRKELDLLDALKDMETVTKLSISANPVDEAGNRLNPLDANLRSIGLSGLELVANDSAEFAALQAYARYDEQNDVSLVNAFRVERASETDAWNAGGYGDLEGAERLLLWHGASTTRVAAILRHGLSVSPPQAPRYMWFGKAIYFHDMMPKAASHCYPHLSDGISLLLLCDVVAKPCLDFAEWAWNSHQLCNEEGKIANRALGRVRHAEWKDAGPVLHNDELIGCQMPSGAIEDVSLRENETGWDKRTYTKYAVYNPAQVRLRYLVTMKGTVVDKYFVM